MIFLVDLLFDKINILKINSQLPEQDFHVIRKMNKIVPDLLPLNLLEEDETQQDDGMHFGQWLYRPLPHQKHRITPFDVLS